MKSVLFSILFFSTALASPSWEELSPPLSITLSQEEVELGDPFHVQLVAAPPAGYKLNREQLRERASSANLFGPPPFTLIEEKESSDGGKVTIDYLIDTHLAGDYFFSFRMIELQSIDGKSPPISVATPAFPIEVRERSSAIPAVNEELYPPLPLALTVPPALSPDNRQRYLTGELPLAAEAERNISLQNSHSFPFYHVGGAACILAAVGGLGLLRRRLLAHESGKERQLQLQERAYNELKALKERSFNSQHSYDEGYTELTGLVRQLIEQVWHLEAPTLTTDEFLEQISDHPAIDDSLQEMLQRFLEAADQVKFANAYPPRQQWEQALEATALLLEQLFPAQRNR